MEKLFWLSSNTLDKKLQYNYSISIDKIKFEWDALKASSNERKHCVSFEEAKSAFFDDNALVIHGCEHSDNEERFVLLGLSSIARILVVCHCY